MSIRIVRLEVFGARMDAEFDGTEWRLSAIGEGKRAPVNVTIPEFIGPDDVAQHHLRHEGAKLHHPDVRRLPDD